jgi:predicted transcriptional regulator
MARPSGVKISEGERPDLVEQVAALDRRGLRQYQIAERAGLSVPTVRKLLDEAHAHYAAGAAEKEAQRGRLKALLEDLRAEAFAAYDSSKGDREKVVREKGRRLGREAKKAAGAARGGDRKTLSGSLVLLKEIVTKEGRLPASDYLRLVHETVRTEAALYGLNADETVNLNVTGVDWDALAGRAQHAPPLDPLQAMVYRAEAEARRVMIDDGGVLGGGINGRGG